MIFIQYGVITSLCPVFDEIKHETGLMVEICLQTRLGRSGLSARMLIRKRKAMGAPNAVNRKFIIIKPLADMISEPVVVFRISPMLNRL